MNFNHTPVYCQIARCKNEATRWIEDDTKPNGTFYFCLEHKKTAKAEEEGELNGFETAVYQCHDDCLVCD